MTAYIDVVPAQGGVGLTTEILREILLTHRVANERIDLASLKAVIAASEPARVTVAIGRAAIKGVDSQFNSLVAEPVSAKAHEGEDPNDTVDYLAGKLYVTVKPQSPLMERIAPKAGKDGYDIFGQPILAVRGAAIPWAQKMPGTYFDKKNPNILVAKVAGHPVFLNDGGRIDATLVFDKVDISTGHVKFDGSVMVEGDVHPDMKVEATGDIFIKGVVERAQVKAGNNLIVDGGVFGDSSKELPEEGLPEYECILEAGGSIEAQFVNLAYLNAVKNINVREYVFNSNLKAGKRVAIGNRGGKGKLVGGETYAVESVTAKTLGSQAYNVTKITLGFSKSVTDLLQKLDFIRDQRVNQAKKLRELLPPTEPAGNEKIERSEGELDRIQKIETTLSILKDALIEIDRRRKKALPQEHDYPRPFIRAKSASYPNCYLEINGASVRTKAEQKAITYEKKNGRIVRKG